MGNNADNTVSFLEHRLKRSPVHYTIDFTHDEKGFYFFVHGVQDSPKDREAVARDLQQAAESLALG